MADKNKATDKMHGGDMIAVTDSKATTNASSQDRIKNDLVLKGTFHPEKEEEFTKSEGEQDFT